MFDTGPARPAPIGDVRAGRYYDTIEVAAYRMAQGVSQVELARVLGTSQTSVSYLETNAHPEEIPAWEIVKVLDAIDRLAKRRRAMQASGSANLAGIRGETIGT